MQNECGYEDQDWTLRGMEAEEAFKEREWAHEKIMQQMQLLREVHQKVTAVEPADVGVEEESLIDSGNDPDLIRDNDGKDDGENSVNRDDSTSNVERDPASLRSNSDVNGEDTNNACTSYFDVWEREDASMSTENNDD